jgi:hypothetical protein
MDPIARLLAAFRAAPWWMKPLYAVTWLAFLVIVFVASASVLFVWLGKLGSYYPLSSVETYYQWLAYLAYYRNLSVLIWLVASAILPGMLIVLVHVRAFQRVPRDGSSGSLYGETEWATPHEIKRAGFSLKRRPRP